MCIKFLNLLSLNINDSNYAHNNLAQFNKIKTIFKRQYSKKLRRIKKKKKYFL